MKFRRAVSVTELLNKKFIEMPFEGKFKASFGIPERSGVWLVWGHSGNGKTRFLLQLAKEMAKYGKVAYDTLEEGARLSFQKAIRETNMKELSGRFIILNREPIEELKERLKRRKSPDIIIIDSFQYTGLTKPQYIALKEEFDKKLFIFISHADGKNPSGRPAVFVRYDADVKIRIEGYRAFPVSRYGGGEPFTIWHEGARDYYQEIKD